MLRGLSQSSAVKQCLNVPVGSASRATTLSTTIHATACTTPSMLTNTSVERHVRRHLSGFYTPYQDDVRVYNDSVPEKPKPSPASNPTPTPQPGDLLEINAQQMVIIGAQQAGVEAVAYLLAQSYGNDVREINHENLTEVMLEVSRSSKPFVLWADTPDIMTKSALAEILPTPMIITIYLDYPPSELPPMKELTMDGLLAQYTQAPSNTSAESEGGEVRRDPLAPHSSIAAHEHDSAYMYDDHYDYRIMVHPGESPNQVFDRLNSRLMLSEAYVSTRGGHSSEANVLAQMHLDADEEPDIIAFPQTFESIWDHDGGVFMPDMPSPWLLSKSHMFNVNKDGDIDKVENVEPSLDPGLEIDNDAEKSDEDADAPDFQGSVIEMAFLPQNVRRLANMTYEQRLQRVLEAMPLGNIPPTLVSQSLQQAFFQWDNPAIVALSPRALVVRTDDPGALAQTYHNRKVYFLDLFNGPTGSHLDIVHGVSNAMMQAAVQHNNFVSQLHGIPPNHHKSVGYIGGTSLHNTISAIAHISDDHPLVSLIPLNTPTRATTTSYRLDDHTSVPVGHFDSPAGDVALLYSLWKKRANTFVAGVKSGDYYSYAVPVLCEELAKRCLNDEFYKREMHEALGGFTTTTTNFMLPVQTYALASTIVSGYADMLKQGVIAPLPDYNEEQVKKHIHAQIGRAAREKARGILDALGPDADKIIDAVTGSDMGEVSETETTSAPAAKAEEDDEFTRYYNEVSGIGAESSNDVDYTQSTDAASQTPEIDWDEFIPTAFPKDSPQAYSQWDFPFIRTPEGTSKSNTDIQTVLKQLQPCSFDLALNSRDLDMVLAAVCARDMGVPIRKATVGVSCDERIVYELLKFGVVRKPVSAYRSRSLSLEKIAILERIIFILSGRNTATTTAISNALHEHVAFVTSRVDNAIFGTGMTPAELALEKLNAKEVPLPNPKNARKLLQGEDDAYELDESAEGGVIARVDAGTLAALQSIFHVDIIAKRIEWQAVRDYLTNFGRILDRQSALSVAGTRSHNSVIPLRKLAAKAWSNRKMQATGKLLVEIPMLVPALVHPEREATALLHTLLKRKRSKVSRRATGEDIRNLAISEIEGLYKYLEEQVTNNPTLSAFDQHRKKEYLPSKHHSLSSLIADSPIVTEKDPELPILAEDEATVTRTVTAFMLEKVGMGHRIPLMPHDVSERIIARAKADAQRQRNELLERKEVNRSLGRFNGEQEEEVA